MILGGEDVPALGVEVDRSDVGGVGRLIFLIGVAIVDEVVQDYFFNPFVESDLALEAHHGRSLLLEILKPFFEFLSEDLLDLLLDLLVQCLVAQGGEVGGVDFSLLAEVLLALGQES